MKEQNFDFTLEPGKVLDKKEYIENSLEISVIIPFYNDLKYIEQTVNCILNQTYPYYELLIIDDGSKDKESLKKLEEVQKLDPRIKVFHKQNEGLAATRDYGVKQASKETKYFMFLDSDDLIDKTYLECAYWALETNKEAGWAYTDSVGFDAFTYIWTKWFDSKRMKKVNDLVSAALVRREAYFAVNGYELREKAVNEDWNFWLKLIAKGYYPVHMSYIGQWYRRKDSGELARATQNRKRALEIIKKTASTIKKEVQAVQYPKADYNYETLLENQPSIVVPKKKEDDKINILMIVPWMVTGGADIFNLELVKRLDKNRFHVTIVSTEPGVNIYRQRLEQYGTVYDLTTFLDRKDWLSFINYIMQKENINLIFNTNSSFGYSMLPYLKANYPSIPIIDYVHMEEWYYQNGGYARISSSYQQVIDKTLVCNKGTENVLIDHFHRNPKEVQTVYIGVDTNKFDPDHYDKQELLKKYGLEDNDKFIISYICRIAAQKRPMLLLEIMKKILKERQDVLFVIAGDGEMLPQLKSGVKKYDIEKNVMFLGNVDKTVEVYRISDVTLNCSIKEGLALTSYESLSMGVPVISSDVGGQKELINEEVGQIVPCMQQENEIHDFHYSDAEIQSYVDAMNKVLKDLKRYKKNCRKRILNQFTLEQMAENMMNIFEETVKHPNKEKEQFGNHLGESSSLTKEIVSQFLITEIPKANYQVQQYMKVVYGITPKVSKRYHIKSRIRDFLWKNPLWRAFVKSPVWKFIKKVVK